MNLIIIHKSKGSTNNSDNMLQFALANESVAAIIFEGLSRTFCRNINKSPFLPLMFKSCHSNIIYAIPAKWKTAFDATQHQEIAQRQKFFRTTNKILRYGDNIRITSDIINKIERKNKPESWLVMSNGRFATHINNQLLGNILTDKKADILAVNAESRLLCNHEKIRLTTESNIAGFRRLYSDSYELVPNCSDWPHLLFIRARAFKKLFADGILPESFSAFIKNCQSNTLNLRTVNIGGTVLDLFVENELLEFCKITLAGLGKSAFENHNSKKISKDPRFTGKILSGKNIQVDPNAVIIGPAIICRNAHIEKGAVINSSIVGPEVHVPQNQLVNNCIIKDASYDWKQPIRHNVGGSMQISRSEHNINQPLSTDDTYRNWPRFSYVRSIKRVADCLIAAIILILFAPLIPFISIAIKLNSPGPVFYKDKRQGLHGKKFNCLKFRTMVTGADKIQEKLRFVSQVDGPQFKMTNDPRISTVGRFLRETYIDEIPQFFNVLLGQMSVVGPRPSPESENTLCPFWRDARLSVRPGITGLWQICRTRTPMKDFQEWIQYDTEYVRQLSLKMDLWICWQTIKKLVENFINQF